MNYIPPKDFCQQNDSMTLTKLVGGFNHLCIFFDRPVASGATLWQYIIGRTPSYIFWCIQSCCCLYANDRLVVYNESMQSIIIYHDLSS